MTDVLFAIGDAIMLAAIIGTIVFAISYGVFFNWRGTPAGRSLMYFVLALVAWALQSFYARIDADYPGRPWTRIVVYALIAATVWRLVVTLWRSWHKTPIKIEPRKKDEHAE